MIVKGNKKYSKIFFNRKFIKESFILGISLLLILIVMNLYNLDYIWLLNVICFVLISISLSYVLIYCFLIYIIKCKKLIIIDKLNLMIENVPEFYKTKEIINTSYNSIDGKTTSGSIGSKKIKIQESINFKYEYNINQKELILKIKNEKNIYYFRLIEPNKIDVKNNLTSFFNLNDEDVIIDTKVRQNNKNYTIIKLTNIDLLNAQEIAFSDKIIEKDKLSEKDVIINGLKKEIDELTKENNKLKGIDNVKNNQPRKKM